MNFLTLENISKTYGEKVLFDKIDLQINKGQKVALVAKNGSGKTTLLRVIAGQEAPEGESANVLVRKDVRIGFLPQEPEFYEGHTVLEAVLESDNPLISVVKEYEEAMLFPEEEERMRKALTKMDDLKAWDTEAKIKEVLSKFNIDNFDKLVKHLSGGQKKRLALAKMVIDEPEFIILDEPTNHLDLDMIEWMEEYLQSPNLTLFMVTHDRYFLERVCNTIVELDRGNLYKYSGNYADFLEKKAARIENEAVVLDKNKKLYKKELEWVNRMPQARTTKSKSRVGSFYDLKESVYQKKENTELSIDIKGQRLGKKILELHHITKRFGDKVIVDGFSYKFKKREKVGIVGPNGVGKTTFLHMLTKSVRVDGGKVVIGDNTVFGYYTQSGISLQDDKRVIDVIQDIAEYIPMEKGQKLTAAQLLERFLFSRKQQQVYVSQLSGGEKRRLYLLTILMRNPNFLILDEPTNDLDILTLNVLEDFLMDFPGCTIIVSHDRYFMDKIVDHLFVFQGKGMIKDFNGVYSEYRVIEKEQEKERRREERASQAKEKEKNNTQKPTTTNTLTYEERKEMNRLEKEIGKLEDKKKELTEKFNDPTLTAEQITDYSKELNALNEKIEEKEMRWMELAELS
ncbi:MAG: ABC-F family ATP-binding cassette domain-containing protein [Bacteroidota bacterium]